MYYRFKGIQAVYHREKVYGFGYRRSKDVDSDSWNGLVFRFDMESRTWNTLLKTKISCVGIENRIYVIDDKVSIYLYDIETDCYSATVMKLNSKSKVGKEIKGRIFIYHRNRYKIYS